MSGLLRTVASRAAPVLRGPAVPLRANLHAGPGKEKFGTVETVIGLSLFSIAILGPSGWILAHLEDYKNRP
ncbi:cytochrome c oxidase subunit 8A, mitochondrial-like [Spinachia spinachia]